MIHLIGIAIGAFTGYLLFLLDTVMGWGLLPANAYALYGGIAGLLLTLFGRQRVTLADQRFKEAQLAVRILSAKISRANGGVTDMTLQVNNQALPDTAGDGLLRAQLRNAAYASPDGWETYSKKVHRTFRQQPDALYERMKILVAIASTGPKQMTPEAQNMLLGIARQWKIGPKQLSNLIQAHGQPIHQQLNELTA